jgi:N-acetylmuramoyl-L-alanine amidase
MTPSRPLPSLVRRDWIRWLQRYGALWGRPGCATFALVPAVAAVLDAQPARDPASSARRRTVIVDAGHGGVDPGTSGITSRGTRVFEKHITLGVAQKLAARLQIAGVSTVMTRTRDTLIALADRGHIANRHEGDLFISIHVNAANRRWANPTGARGFETFFLAEAKTEDERRVAQMENEVVRFETDADLSPGDDAIGFMLNDLAQNEHLRESSALAQIVQDSLGAMHPGPSRGVKQAGFLVLVRAFMPAVLVEIGFGSNPSEAAWLASSSGQAQVATAIAKAVLGYLAAYERRVSGTAQGFRK